MWPVFHKGGIAHAPGARQHRAQWRSHQRTGPRCFFCLGPRRALPKGAGLCGLLTANLNVESADAARQCGNSVSVTLSPGTPPGWRRHRRQTTVPNKLQRTHPETRAWSREFYTTASAELTPAEQQRWASELLPDTESASPNPVRAAAPINDPGVTDTQELPRPLDGVHFARLSRPGPSDMRPEHLRDMLGCNRRRAVNRLIRALHATEVLAAAGALPACWRWMLGSRLVFIAKKNGRKPRPIRVGEVWRRTVAKHMLHQHNAKVRQRMIAAHQYGVAIPGGAESLIHARRLLEDCSRLDAASGQLSTSILSTRSHVSSGALLMPQWQHSCQSLRPGLGGDTTSALDVELNKAILMVRCSAESSLRTSCIPLLKRWPDGRASARQCVFLFGL